MKKQTDTRREIMVLLARADMTQADLARELGVTRCRVHQILKAATPRGITRVREAITRSSGG